MKDDSGSYAVFTEQGPSASQMTAAKVMDVIARPQDCAGQAADAVSADTLVNMQDAPTLLKIPKPEYPDTDNSLGFGKSCEELSWNHCTSTPHRSETNGIAERAVRRVKEGTSAVLLQSGLDEKWWADSMECYCYPRNIQDLLSDGKNTIRKAVRNALLTDH